MYMAVDIAKYIINKCTIEQCPISNLQLQKILYAEICKRLKENELDFLQNILVESDCKMVDGGNSRGNSSAVFFIILLDKILYRKICFHNILSYYI